MAASLGLAACGDAGQSTGPSAAPLAGPRGQDSKLEAVLLGTMAGPPVEPDRAGISTALVVDGHTYLVDCGRSATTQYVKSGLTLKSLDSIFLTHLHADHLADYYNFFLLGGSIPNTDNDNLPGPIGVYGPGPAGGLPPKFGGGDAPTVNPADPTPGTAAMTEKMHEAYAYSGNILLRDMGIRDIRSLAEVHEIALPEVGASFQNTHPDMDPFPVMEDDRVKVTATLVPHGPMFPAFAFRFDTDRGSVTFSGDTTYSDNVIKLAKGSDVLLHEAINMEGDMDPAVREHMLQSHVDIQKVGKIAQTAEVPKLVLTHIANAVSGRIDADQWQKWASQGYDGEVEVGEDLQRITIA